MRGPRYALIAGCCVLAHATGCTDREAGIDPVTESCDGPVVRPVELASFPRLEVSAWYGADIFAAPSERKHRFFNVIFTYDHDYILHHPEVAGPFHAADGSYCPVLVPGFTVSVDGLDPAVVSPGAAHCDASLGLVCSRPSIEFTNPRYLQIDNAQLVLADNSRTITIELGDALKERTAVPVGVPGSFHPGQQVTFTWSPATDLTALPELGGYVSQPCSGASCPLDGVKEYLLAPFTRGTDTITFTMPDTTGPGTLALELSSPIVGTNPHVRQSVFRDIILAP